MIRRGGVFLLGVTVAGTNPAEIKNISLRGTIVLILTDYAVSGPAGIFYCS